ncbi:MAG TPA: VanW family protein [Chthonomonadales bacterium]|nr:VanW family protein [Chthonomonadales bacterium]
MPPTRWPVGALVRSRLARSGGRPGLRAHGRVALKVLVVAMSMLAGATATALTAFWRSPASVIPGGVHVAGANWSGKRVEEASQALQAWAESRAAEPVALRALTPSGVVRQWSPSRATLGASVDVQATVEDAMRIGDRGSAFTRLVAWFSGAERVDVPPVWTVDRPALKRYLKRRVAPSMRLPALNARFVATGDTFSISPERQGVALDLDRAAALIERRVPLDTTDVTDLPSRTVAPRVAAKDFEGIEGEIARFQTRYSERGNRRRNIEIACERIDGTLVRPGEVFSYNETVGPRSFDAGFREAPIIVRGRMEPGVGGGICQVSATLYNAVLLADLGIVARQRHSFPVQYVPSGRDASVVYGVVDFQFRNTTDAPIAIHSDGRRGRVLVRVFGRREPGRRVVLVRRHLASYPAGVKHQVDETLAPGETRVVEKGHAGQRVRLYRVVYQGDQVVRRELISNDFYRPFPRIVAVGPAPARQPAPTAQAAGYTEGEPGLPAPSP